MSEHHTNSEQPQSDFFDHNDISSTEAEELQVFIKTLVHEMQIQADLSSKDRESHPLPDQTLKLAETWLDEAHRYFRETSRQASSLTYASEWILDNYYIIRQTLLLIKEGIPSSFYEELPKISGGVYAGLPRISVIASAVLSYHRLIFDSTVFHKTIGLLQQQMPLTMGELWAFPVFLRYHLIIFLSHALASIIHPDDSPTLPDIIQSLPGFKSPIAEPDSSVEKSVNNDHVANIILSLRAISEQNWNDFFESVSCQEQTLRQDPAGIYPKMDFKTRDLYRKEIEKISFFTGRDECELAKIIIQLAEAESLKLSTTGKREYTDRDDPIFDLSDESIKPDSVHIGEFLLGNKRPLLEQKISLKPDYKTKIKNQLKKHGKLVYFSSIFLFTILLLLTVWAVVINPTIVQSTSDSTLGSSSFFTSNVQLLRMVLIILLVIMVIPALTIATSLVNWLVTVLIKPRILPKMSFKKHIPKHYRTLVVTPAILTNREEIDSLVKQMELHYLRNLQSELRFALLSDFRDADQESLPEDQELIQYAQTAIQNLNQKYMPLANDESSNESPIKFHLLHRKRLFNPSENKWMGWERKRGKLLELNHFLRGARDLSFISSSETPTSLTDVKYVITLDADTILPIGAASRLIGTLAHPLNQPVFDETTGQVISGYTILQPRIEIHPKSVNYSWFTRIFAGDTGLDLYSLAVSDTYQDLFGEGIYVGKGIYDIDAFERSVGQHIPENTILSHDLLEGVIGRAGLVTDITMIEDYPQNYLIRILRQRRWIRGDWQLLPWLFNPRKFGVSLSALDRWKITDNLLRSLLSPALVMIFIIGLVFFPNFAGLWTLILLIALGIPVLTGIAQSSIQIIGGEYPVNALRPLSWHLIRWLLSIAFLIYESYISLDAIITTLYRLLISRRNLLQWTTAAQTTKFFRLNTRKNVAWQKMAMSVLAAAIITMHIQFVSELARNSVATALIYASLVLILWLLSPMIVWLINRPIIENIAALSEEQTKVIRQVIRRTWGFFERFVGPEDHWLPPDHYQENPLGMVAHRTSPSNIGLLLTSTLAAYDFGYLDHFGLAARLKTTLETLTQLERFRGHFLNWYDTLTLQPLQPRYVSTVDSGNLAACLIVTSQASKTMPDQFVFRWELWQGYLDTLSSLSEILNNIPNKEFTPQIKEINRRLNSLRSEILKVRSQTQLWYPLFRKASGPFWQDLSERLMALVTQPSPAFDHEALGNLQEVTSQIERQHTAVNRTITELFPWIPLFENIPERLQSSPYAASVENLRTYLPNNLTIAQIQPQVQLALTQIFALKNDLTQENLSHEKVETPTPVSEDDRFLLQWLDDFTDNLAHAEQSANNLLNQYTQISTQCEQFSNEMNFNFLYHPSRRIFHIGYNLDAGLLDKNYYDLLASEARIASVVAIAKGDVPPSHWLYLSRPIAPVEGTNVLLSWSGTMFEYLMPPLFLRSYDRTMLAESTTGAVRHQIAYGKSKNVPWGISESGFYRFDNNQNYQYRAFGVPGLGLKRGLGDDLVIAPYASLMAIGRAPHAVAQNLNRLIKQKMLGLYGLYEAIDFTHYRLPLDENFAIVEEYMVHHQGMILMAMVNFFYEDIMVRRMHSDPRIQSVEILLQEQIPQSGTLHDLSTEEAKGIQRLTPAPVEITPWRVPLQTPIPQVHLLSNGSYNVIISNMGAGYSAWRKTSLTRWQPDGTLDAWGTWIYIQDIGNQTQDEGKIWSAAHQPIPGRKDELQVTFFAHMAVFRRTEDGIASTMEVTVAPDDPAEIRRMHLHNQNDSPRTLRLTSYGEVILTPQANDARHPAFNKLFITSEFIPELNLLLFTRRPRSADENSILMGHMLVSGADKIEARYETDRYQFIGRGSTQRNPSALSSDQYLTGTTGATLDPIFSLGTPVLINPHQSLEFAFITFSAESREELLEMARRYQNWTLINHTYHQSNIAAHTWLSKQNINKKAFKDILQVLSAMIYPFKAVRALPQTLEANQLGQPGLWRFGISGDYPILLVKIDDNKQLDLVQEALLVHKYLRSRRFKIDLILINRQKTDYGAELNSTFYRLVHRMNEDDWLNKNGGIFILFEDQMNPDERILLDTAARMILDGKAGTLNNQLPGYSMPVRHLPSFTPTRLSEVTNAAQPPYTVAMEPMHDLQFKNGFGGFSSDGREYIIEVKPGKPTPAPWVNVIGYPEFGFMVSESGSQCTWSLNSGENRLTPWSNDPVIDPTGEALYLRDEETGEVWSPTPHPAGSAQPYRVRHGAGYTVFEHNSHGLRQTLTLIASPSDPIKLIHLKLENTLPHTRRITATQYVEWVLGTTHATNMPYIVPHYESELKSLLASNPYNAEFGKRVAFLSSSKTLHGVTADRTEFFGRGGSTASPIALKRIGLESRITPGEDPCAVLQVHIDLPPSSTETFYFMLGQGNDKEHALSLIKKYQTPSAVKEVFESCTTLWERLLATIQVNTPEPAIDLMLNRWTLYQALSCRIWGRTAFYQSSGAFGFRDQLQDVLALIVIDPNITRDQIINAARHQFEEGDVMHWWHPPSGRGVRTRITDDLLWMPYVITYYVKATGDRSILEEKIPFKTAPLLSEHEEERYNEFPQTAQTYSLLEHCHRAIQHACTTGALGLPLIGTGDWNDGLNKVGEKGHGESVWLAWFLIDVLHRFADLCELIGDLTSAQQYRDRANQYTEAANTSAWDGEWFLRGTYDSGKPLGSSQNLEGRIDAIAQSWSVLSGGGQPDRSQQAMQSVLNHLVRPEDRLSLLFTPPFDKTAQNPGYIKGYLPGIRENGGQYTHAAIWTAWAFAQMRDGEQAGFLYNLLNPIFQSDTYEKAVTYRVEPYVICADIYSVEPYTRRGGWTWYTGSAAWTYRLGLEAILGFRKIGETLTIDPTIPPSWEGYTIRYQYGKSVYHIHVKNPEHVTSGIKQTLLDGKQLENGYFIPLEDKQREYMVEIILGKTQTKVSEALN